MRAIKAVKRKVAEASAGLPSVQQWLDRVAVISPALAEAVAGIWCGREGKAELYVPEYDRYIMVGWHGDRVEFSYLS